VFVDDEYGAMPGTLPMSAVGLVGSSSVPRPAIVVAFKNFYLNPEDLQSGVQVSDNPLREGQGMHGGFGRESTFNTMVAFGPDFKTTFADAAPASNADIAPTVARVLGFRLPSKGKLTGRVLGEALVGGGNAATAATKMLTSPPAANGTRTAVFYQELDGERYALTGCRVSGDEIRTTPDVCRR